MSEGRLSPGSHGTFRLELVRPANLNLRVDRSMTDLYRTRGLRRPPVAVEDEDTVVLEFPRSLLSPGRRGHQSMVVLNGSVPWRIAARGPVTKLTADLGPLQLLGFEVAGRGASEMFLALPPPRGEVPIRIDGGATNIGMHRPSGAPVRVRVTGGTSGLSLDDQRFGAVAGETLWHSHDFGVAADRYDIQILGGARNVTIDTLDIGGSALRRSGRHLATVLFTDIVGSTERARAMGDRRWRDLLDRHDVVSRKLVQREHGTVVKTTGDGILAVFDGPGEAIRSARALRDDLGGMGLTIRAGLHSGEVEYRGEDVGGIAVHVGARIMDAAAPGEILVSRTVRDLVAGADLDLAERGTQALRGLEGDWQLFSVG